MNPVENFQKISNDAATATSNQIELFTTRKGLFSMTGHFGIKCSAQFASGVAMSSIYKLSISGIRSFSDETQETIQFGKPLTLIVGTNGSGKTTIIECLRYATTNELPPNTKNGALFINDPNLHNANETKAQIKLAFVNNKHINMILSKSLMSSKNIKSGSINFKTKENQLMAINHGEKQTISSKIADIEKLIPYHLGVSKSILNYVVFCHQDDSFWPISESSVLKKKFDEIFDSSKFIKILDSIKSINKEINSDIKLINNNVQHLQNDKQKSNLKKSKINELSNEIEFYNDEIESVKTSLEKINENLSTLFTSNQDYERVISKIESLKHDHEKLLKNIELIKLTTEPLNKPREALQDDLNNFTNTIANQLNHINKLKQQIEHYTKEIDENRNELESQNLTLASKRAIADEIHRKKQYLKNLEHEIYDKKLIDPSKVENDIDIALRESKLSLSQHKNQRSNHYKEVIDGINANLERVRETKIKYHQQVEYMTTDYNNNMRKLSQLESKYANVPENQSKLVVLRKQLENKQEMLNEIISNDEVGKIVNKLTENSNLIRKDEFELDSIKNKLKLSRFDSEVLSKIKFLKDINDRTNNEIIEVKNKIQPIHEVTKYLQNTYSSEIIEVQEQIDLNNEKIFNVESKISKAKMNRHYISEQRNQLKIELSELSSKFMQLQKMYNSIYGDELKLEEYTESLKNIEDNYIEELEDSKDIQFLTMFNKRAIAHAEKKHICYLCKRKFDDGFQLSKFLEILEIRTNELSSKKNNDPKTEIKKQCVDELKAFQNSVLTIKDIREVLLPELDVKEVDLKRDVFNHEEELKTFKSKFQSLDDEMKMLKSIENDVLKYTRALNDISKNEGEIYKLEQQLSNNDSTMDVTQLEKREVELDNEIKRLRTEIQSLQIDKDLKYNKKVELENDINKMKLSINELELKSLDVVNLEKLIEETKKEIDELNSRIHDAKPNIVQCDSQIQSIINELKGATNHRDQEIKIFDDKLMILERYHQEFIKIMKEIEVSEATVSEVSINEIIQSIENKKRTIERMVQENVKNNEELRRLELLSADSNNQERNIRANLNLLQYEADLITIEEQIKELDMKKALAQREEYLIKINELQKTQQSYQKNYAVKLGELTQLNKQRVDLIDEVSRDYKDIDVKYSNEYSKLQTKLALATDLTTLYKATDNGVMEFHQTQMLKINNIIDELWKKTYMGNDIETIKIKSDPISMKKQTDSIASNNRSYNYRVVMIKNGTELDMRGRCSAGQKVLASIIIRIALAECFCLNFGMIALDEPTTNLDDENIESLAKSLHSIIKERSAQKNFQLIIITHDEKFLRCMNAVDFTDHYYKVIRDERLNSTINKVSIATVTE